MTSKLSKIIDEENIKSDCIKLKKYNNTISTIGNIFNDFLRDNEPILNPTIIALLCNLKNKIHKRLEQEDLDDIGK